MMPADAYLFLEKNGSVANLHIDGGAGGAVSVWGEGGKGAVGLGINDTGGRVSVIGKDGVSKAGLAIDNAGPFRSRSW